LGAPWPMRMQTGYAQSTRQSGRLHREPRLQWAPYAGRVRIGRRSPCSRAYLCSSVDRRPLFRPLFKGLLAHFNDLAAAVRAELVEVVLPVAGDEHLNVIASGVPNVVTIRQRF